jgi:hypothetical protein
MGKGGSGRYGKLRVNPKDFIPEFIILFYIYSRKKGGIEIL